MSERAKRCTADIFLFAVLILIDRLTKIWADSNLAGADPIPLIKNVLELFYLPNGNSGAAFGMLSGHRVLFLVIAFIVVACIAYLVFNIPSGKKYRSVEILLVFIASGGVGNMIDRFLTGFVTDFIYISCINFPIFNVADMYVSVCTVVLALIVIFRMSDEDYSALEESFAAPLRKIFSKKR